MKHCSRHLTMVHYIILLFPALFLNGSTCLQVQLTPLRLQYISKRALNRTECKYLYQQLPPAKQTNDLSHFYLHASKVVLNYDIIGSVSSRSHQ